MCVKECDRDRVKDCEKENMEKWCSEDEKKLRAKDRVSRASCYSYERRGFCMGSGRGCSVRLVAENAVKSRGMV